ncbi:MAG TPA: hypothetical protein VMI32_07165 [Candidatus Solibacter sp.]|nr:hypothetical protein [Candidatus Solibacter sp.]
MLSELDLLHIRGTPFSHHVRRFLSTHSRVTIVGAIGNMANDGINTLDGACHERSRKGAGNHVVFSTSGGSCTHTHTYDGDRQHVKKVGRNTIVTIFASAQVLAE